MAGKGRRAAARQGELSRRRKRGQRGPSGIPASVPHQGQGESDIGVAPPADAEAEFSANDEAQQARPAAATAATATASPSRPARRPGSRARGERPAAHNYVGAELRRIAALATVALAALVVLSFVI